MNLSNGDKMIREKRKINLSTLKELPIVDFELRDKIKDYINDLIFALYFNINIGKVGFNRAKAIKEKCKENKFYKIITRNN